MNIKNTEIVLKYIDLEYDKEEKRINESLEKYSNSINEKIKELNSMIINFNLAKEKAKSHLNNIKLFQENKVYEINTDSYINMRNLCEEVMGDAIDLRTDLIRFALLHSNDDEKFINLMKEFETK